MFENRRGKCLYCYGIWTDTYSEMENELADIEFHKGLPSLEILEEFADGSHNMVVLDDLMTEVGKTKDADKIFTLGAHHLKLTILYVSQSLFSQLRNVRAIILSTHYTILFDNKRDLRQIDTLRGSITGTRRPTACFQRCR